jgi:hypothetical protein
VEKPGWRKGNKAENQGQQISSSSQLNDSVLLAAKNGEPSLARGMEPASHYQNAD